MSWGWGLGRESPAVRWVYLMHQVELPTCLPSLCCTLSGGGLPENAFPWCQRKADSCRIPTDQFHSMVDSGALPVFRGPCCRSWSWGGRGSPPRGSLHWKRPVIASFQHVGGEGVRQPGEQCGVQAACVSEGSAMVCTCGYCGPVGIRPVAFPLVSP